MNIRTTKIVAPLVAMALCTPNIAIAQENSNEKTISSSIDVRDDFLLTRSISAINRNNNSKPQDPNTIYVNPGDTIHVQLDLKGKTDRANHGFTGFKEKVSPIQEFSAKSGSLTVKKTGSPKPQVRTLDNLHYGTFDKTGDQTIEFTPNKGSLFGDIGNHVTIDYSYTAGNQLGKYQTEFQPDPEFARGSSTFDATKLNLTIVVESKEQPTPPGQGEQPAPPEQGDEPTPPEQGDEPTPPEQGGQDTPPDQNEQVIPPKSNRSTVFSWLTKTLGVLAFLGGTVWFIIKHIFRL
ncbi:proline-rich domain-containing protein [Corynebacterium diphtheriae]|uniref:proline-rich domain-containing protein n=1 Tax=Corynebacterium diphtheriae TaxID=1717 RepID=UPI000245BBA1|nr:proline-rich domain-containing protein [Corynebacterium diphtheriae]AEX47167.1 putative surface-exposed virulence protein bigA [Corynebacterium diphtheriae INCA 402]